MPGDTSHASPVSRLVCAGCGHVVPGSEPFPFRCPRAATGDDVDHVLERVFAPMTGEQDADAYRSVRHNPFLRFRRLMHIYHAARTFGLDDSDYCNVVETLDMAVAGVSGVSGDGFHVTPWRSVPALALDLGVNTFQVKDETGNVAGSHKARHLMGVLIWLAVQERLGHPSIERPLAVASCGNAALAAAVTARAAGRALHAYIPDHADPGIAAELECLGTRLHRCARKPGVPGDPCFHAFRRAVTGGALPYTCQGSENGLVIEGGETLANEIIQELIREGTALDRLFIQVGGGALASACVQAFDRASRLGVIDRLPRMHAVQPEGGHPVAQAWERVSDAVLARYQRGTPGAGAPPDEISARAVFLRDRVPDSVVASVLDSAVTHRSRYVRPWPVEPRSVATGILDDETHDWLAVVRGMLRSGGYPVVVSEATLVEANARARETTDIPVDPTGSAGLAGALTVARAGGLDPDETVAVLFTGVDRSATDVPAQDRER